MLSDSDSSDSDSGVRFKTASTRNKNESSIPQRDAPRASNDNRRRVDDDRDRRHHRYERRSPLNDRKRRSTSRDRSHRRYSGAQSSSHDRRRSSSRDRSYKSHGDQELCPKNKPREHDVKIRHRDRSPAKSKPTKEHEADKSASSNSMERPLSTREKRSISPKEQSKRPSQEKLSVSNQSPTEEHSLHDKSKKSKKTKRNKSHDREPRQTKSNERRSTSSRDSKSMSVQRDVQPAPHKTTPTLHDDSHVSNTNAIDDLMCGPKLPPHLCKPAATTNERSSPPPKASTADLMLGPSLPPSRSDNVEHSPKTTAVSNGQRPVQGPCIPPPHILLQHQHNDDAMSDISEDDDCPFGPVPDGVVAKSEAHLELEKRALELKLAKFGGTDNMDDLVVRDEWMLELPEVKGVTDMGLTARQFRTKARPDMGDRSGWTETPKDRKSGGRSKAPTEEDLRAERQKEARATYNENRDRMQEDAATKHKKKHKRDESLMDLHQKKIKEDKKNKKDEESRPSRRPFSRESDLKVNRFDQAQKNAILKKAQLLDTRFGRGETKYL